MFKNRFFSMAAIAILLLLGAIGKSNADIQRFRFFVQRGSSVYEILTGSGGGGAFISRPTSEVIAGYPVKGYTDRASRGETLFTKVEGSGCAPQIGFTCSRRDLTAWYSQWLPTVEKWYVSTDPYDDDIYVYGYDDRWVLSYRRLPIGSR